jgi:hypothetical protein
MDVSKIYTGKDQTQREDFGWTIENQVVIERV